MEWPRTRETLVAEQVRLAGLTPQPWRPAAGPVGIAGTFVTFAQPATISPHIDAAERAWAAAVLVRDRRAIGRAVVAGAAAAPYEAGALALRSGHLLERAVRRARRSRGRP